METRKRKHYVYEIQTSWYWFKKDQDEGIKLDIEYNDSGFYRMDMLPVLYRKLTDAYERLQTHHKIDQSSDDGTYCKLETLKDIRAKFGRYGNDFRVQAQYRSAAESYGVIGKFSVKRYILRREIH